MIIKDSGATRMKDLYHEHIDITNEVKHTIEKMKIVFPSQYGRLYTELAHAHEIELKPNELLSREMLDDKMVRHIITLGDCADRAIIAIETENKSSLETVLAETEKLREEIYELQQMVYEDSLTKSYNRKWFEDNVLENDKLLLNVSGTIVMIDINKFKEVNDTYGHVVGDKVLVYVAAKLKEGGGRVVRYGGDEFIIIFDAQITSADIREKMEKLLSYFEKIHFTVEEHSFKISFSYGMASFTRGSEIVKVLESADKAMYQQKIKR